MFNPKRAWHDRKRIFSVALILGGVSGFLAWRFGTFDRPTTELPVYGRLPQFSLVDAQNRPVSRDDFHGRVSVVSFLFTRCQTQCPLIVGALKQIQSEFEGKSLFRIVSVSIDPVYDTPAVLAEYAKKVSANPSVWRFLAGESDAIEGLARQGFKLATFEPSVGDSGMIHSQKLIVVDGEGQIRGYYDASDADDISRLRMAVHGLLEN